MPTDTSSRLLETAQRYRDDLEAQTSSAADAITRGWAKSLERVEVEVQSLMAKMEAARLAGVEPSPAWLYQQRRLTALTDSIQAEVYRWAPMAEEATREAAYDAAAMAQAHARHLATEAASVSLPGVEASFTSLNPENMATILGHLAPGGPLRDLLVNLGGETAQAAADTILQGVIMGKGTDWIGRELGRSLDIPRWRAETIARTETLRAYRETSRESYRRSNVVGSWVWTAALDRRTCPACLALHGEEFSVEEQLDGHPRCRCMMVPRTKSWEELGVEGVEDTRPTIETGQSWLDRQPPATQRAILGPGKHDLYRAGKVELPDMVARTHSPEWGSMRRERSMKEMAEGRNANYRDLPQELTESDILEQMVRDEAAQNAARAATRAAEEADLMERVAAWTARENAKADAAADAWVNSLPLKPEGLKKRGLDTPENDARAANPNYNQGGAYQVNCTHTVTAYELRRRGYNVAASGLPDELMAAGGRNLTDLYTRWGHAAPTKVDGVSNLTRKQATTVIENFGEGARGAITVVWKSGHGSHIFSWEVREGKVVFYDPQSGKVLGDAADYFARGKQRVHVIRLDNLTPTDRLEELLG